MIFDGRATGGSRPKPASGKVGQFDAKKKLIGDSTSSNYNTLAVMTNLQKFLAWNRERRRKNRVSLLISCVVFIPAYFLATQFTSSHADAVFISLIVAIVIGVSFGPLVSRFLARTPTNEKRR